MGVDVWISYDEEYIMWDDKPYYVPSSGPIEISNELYERVRECEREYSILQDILEGLDYEWKYPEDD